MGNLTRNFNDWEFRCKHCGANGINDDLVVKLQEFRDYIHYRTGKEHKIIVHSGVRCPEYNNKPRSKGGVGSKETSQHTWDEDSNRESQNRPCAADIHAELASNGRKMSYMNLWKLALEFDGFKGIGRYKWGIHVDTRLGSKARWYSV